VKPGCGTSPMPSLTHPVAQVIFPSVKLKVIKLSLAFALDPVLSCLPRSPKELDVVLLDYQRTPRKW
jgi:hypothetical protein